MRIVGTVVLALMAGVSMAKDIIVPLNDDGIHDTTNAAFELLQEPAEAMANLPVDASGKVDWVKSIQNGHISPRTGLIGTEKMKEVELDITMKNTASMPHVLFSHRVHTQWLTCSNCHSRIFLPQIGGNHITMSKIMEGKYCGVCHGKVAFTALDCERCHAAATNNKGLR